MQLRLHFVEKGCAVLLKLCGFHRDNGITFAGFICFYQWVGVTLQ